MNRTIKFRAWDKKRSLMLSDEHPDNWEGDKDEFYADVAMLQLDLIKQINEDERYEVMQFTGLLDKNGKEIYEGDVVAIDGANAEVCYYAGSPMVKDYFVNHPYSYLSQFDESDVEIIGNIYENPELV